VWSTSVSRRQREFAEVFADGWRIGASSHGASTLNFGERTSRNAAMIQPLAPLGYGPRGLWDVFEPLFRLVPDLVARSFAGGPAGQGS
jgi:hypothetical protein